MPVHIVERLQKMNRAERTLWTQLGREPTLEEIAEEASLPIQQAHEVKAAARASASLDQPVGEQEDAVFGDFVAGDDPLPEEEVEVSLRSQALTAALLSLQERERQVLVLRYGLDDSEPKTLEEIGRRLGPCRPSSEVALTGTAQPRAESSSAMSGSSRTTSVRSGCAITGGRPSSSTCAASAKSRSAGPENGTSIRTRSVPPSTYRFGS